MSKRRHGLAAYRGSHTRIGALKDQEYTGRRRENGAQIAASQPGPANATPARSNTPRATPSKDGLGSVQQRAEIAGTQLSLQRDLQPRQRQTTRNTAAMEAMMPDQDFAQLPQSLRTQVAEGAITTAEAQHMALAKLVDMLDSGVKGQVVQFANGIRMACIFRDPPGTEISDVRMIKGEDGQERIALISANGEPAVALTAMDIETLRAIGRKLDVHTVGKSLVRTDSHGNATPAYTSPEAAAKNAEQGLFE